MQGELGFIINIDFHRLKGNKREIKVLLGGQVAFKVNCIQGVEFVAFGVEYTKRTIHLIHFADWLQNLSDSISPDVSCEQSSLHAPYVLLMRYRKGTQN